MYKKIKINIYSCFSAFPDSNVFEVGDQVYSIRVKASNSLFAESGII